jgi:hypothetical protein
MAERSNAAVLKTVDPKGPGVRIPLSPPSPAEALAKAGFSFAATGACAVASASADGRSPLPLSVYNSLQIFDKSSAIRALSALEAIFKEVQSPQIVKCRAFYFLKFSLMIS